MTHKMIFLNGPPSSGKDEGAKIINRNFQGTRMHKMSRPMKVYLPEIFNLSKEEAKYLEENKEEPQGRFGGKSWRQVQISFSEDWMKPMFGDDVFGRIALKHLIRPTGTTTTIISDCGFVEELLPLVRFFKYQNCLMIHLHRDGCTFEGDSRSYVDLSEYGVETLELHNKYPLEPTEDMPITYAMQLCRVVRNWIGEEQED